MNRAIAPVTKNLLIINVLMFVGTLFWEPAIGQQGVFEYQDIGSQLDLGRYALMAFFPTSKYFEPYQIVTSMFMHGGWMHLLFNMYALWMFGSIVEGVLGPKRYLLFYLISGLGALLCYWAVGFLSDSAFVNVPLLGASGAIFGVLVGFAYIAPDAILQLIIPPIPLKAKYFVLILIGIDLYLGLGSYNTGVAHFAHLGGAAVGFLLLTLWSRQGGLYQR